MAINTLFKNIADAIRTKGETSDTLTPAQMPQAILDLPSGGGGDVEILTPIYKGLSYAYISYGTFYGSSQKTKCLILFEVSANETYLIYKNDSSGNRCRAGFYANKTLSDFENGINNPNSGTLIDATDDIISKDDSNNYSSMYSPSKDGIIGIVTSTQSVIADAGCIKV